MAVSYDANRFLGMKNSGVCSELFSEAYLFPYQTSVGAFWGTILRTWLMELING